MSSSQSANKLSVLAGFVSPDDPTQKQRPALVMAEIKVLGREYLAVAPITTHYERTGSMPPGAVPLRSDSPAFEGTHLAKDSAISLGSLVMVPADAKWMDNAHDIGRLDLNLDKRLNAQVQDSVGQLGKLMQSHMPDIMKSLQQGEAVSMDTRHQTYRSHSPHEKQHTASDTSELTDTAKAKLLQAAVRDEAGGGAMPSLAEALQAIDKARETSGHVELKLNSGEKVLVSAGDILEAIGERQQAAPAKAEKVLER